MDDRFIVPMFTLVVGGQSITTETIKLISDIEFREVSDGSNELTISIQDPDFVFISGSVFAEETPVSYELTLLNSGYTKSFNGYVSAVDVNFPENGIPTLEVMCMDITHLMNREKKYEKFEKMARSDIAQKIASSYGFKCITDASSGEVEESITQSNQTDIVFIQQMAKQEPEDFITYVQGNTFYYKKRDTSGAAQMELYYREKTYDIRRFKPGVNIEEIKDENKDQNISAEGEKKTGSSTTTKPSGGGNTSGGAGGTQGAASPASDIVTWLRDYRNGGFTQNITHAGQAVSNHPGPGGPRTDW